MKDNEENCEKLKVDNNSIKEDLKCYLNIELCDEFDSALLESFDEYIDKYDFIPKRYFIKLNYSLNNNKIDPTKCLDICIKAINKDIKIPTNLLSCLFDKTEKMSNIKKLICSLIGNNNYDNFILS